MLHDPNLHDLDTVKMLGVPRQASTPTTPAKRRPDIAYWSLCAVLFAMTCYILLASFLMLELLLIALSLK
jgi:hypothetical protein